jgi:serine/threonine protein kinase
MAPELEGYLESVKPKTIDDFKAADMWALGEIVFQMLTGEATFGRPIELMKYCVGQQAFPLERLSGFASSDGRDFLTGIMKALPQDRMTATQCIQHPWMEVLRVDEDFAALALGGYNTSIPKIPLNGPASAQWSALSDLEDTVTKTMIKRKPSNDQGPVSHISEHEQRIQTESVEVPSSSSASTSRPPPIPAYDEREGFKESIAALQASSISSIPPPSLLDNTLKLKPTQPSKRAALISDSYEQKHTGFIERFEPARSSSLRLSVSANSSWWKGFKRKLGSPSARSKYLQPQDTESKAVHQRSGKIDKIGATLPFCFPVL